MLYCSWGKQIDYLSQNLKKERKNIYQLNEIIIKIAEWKDKFDCWFVITLRCKSHNIEAIPLGETRYLSSPRSF